MGSRDPIGTGSKPALWGKTLQWLRRPSLAGELAIGKRSAISSQVSAKTES